MTLREKWVVGKGIIFRWLENLYLQWHLHGCGMEIGALWNPVSVPRRVRVWYVDREGRDGLEKHYPELRGKILQPDLLADASQLPVRPASLDFLIASHILEHLRFPLQALRHWYDALAPGGVLLLKVPDKRYTFDVHRSRTPLVHLLEEQRDPERFDGWAHYADWVENVGGQNAAAPEFPQAVRDLMAQDYSIHFHVWIDEDVREMINFTRQTWGLEWKPVAFWRAHAQRQETMALLRRK